MIQTLNQHKQIIMSETNNFIPYGRQTITSKDIDEVVKVLKSPFITQGPIVPKFENELSKKLKAPYSICVNSATSALHIACLALGLKKNDIAWTSPITFVASANCIKYCGAEIDFVDIDPCSGLMCTDKLERKLKVAKANNKLPKIIIPVHLAGTSCDMKKIYDLSLVYGFSIIEDASHAIGAKFLNKPVGNCEYSNISIFSLHPVKIITSGEGGIATTRDKSLAEKMTALRSHGITKDRNKFKLENKELWYYEQQDLGYNYRMSDIHAALGLSQLNRLDSIIKERNELLGLYSKLLSDLPVKLLHIPKNRTSSVHLAIIRLNNKKKEFHKKVIEGMRRAGIGVQVHYTPVHLQPYFQEEGFHESQFPNAEEYASNAITLPLFPGLTKEEQELVIIELTNHIR